VGGVEEAGNPRLRWGSLSPTQMDDFLQDLSHGANSSMVSLAPSDRDKFRALPAFETLSGSRVALVAPGRGILSRGNDDQFY
ncbi:unnamed protein product, partial [Heterosigma akashiwo]